MMWPQKVGCVILSYSSNGTTSPAMTCTQRTFTPRNSCSSFNRLFGQDGSSFSLAAMDSRAWP